METTLLISVILLNIVLLLVMGFLGFLLYKLLKERNQSLNSAAPQESGPSYHPEIQKRLNEIKFSQVKTENIFCPYHPEEPGEVQCGICHKYYCNRCVRPMKSIYFCKEHMALFLRSQWQEVLTIKTSSDDPEAGVHLFDRKQEIFQNENIPSYVETHYKIDVEGDYIETYLVVYGQEEQIEDLKTKFQS